MTIFLRQRFEDYCARHPPGFREGALQVAIVTAETVALPEDALASLRTQFPFGKSTHQAPAREPTEPTIPELAANFTGAMERWVKAGFATVSAEQYAARSTACEACELWDGKARLGLGKCNAPGCGCTKFKRWLAPEQCKHPAGSRWPNLP